MCRVTAIREVETCLDGTTIKEFDLDSTLTDTIMRRIAEGGKLCYFPTFPRPYFRIDKPGAYVVQGVIGRSMFRVVFSQSETACWENHLQTQIEKGDDDGR